MLTRLLSRRVAAAVLGGTGAVTALSQEREPESTTTTPSEPKRTKSKRVGGVRDEYTKEPRAVVRLSPPLDGFFSKQIIAAGVPIRAHECVPDAALLIAADRISRMLRPMPDAIHARLARRGASIHIIGIDQGTTDLPEHSHMKGVPGGYTQEADTTLDQRARGMGGLHASCGEENLCDLDSDPRYPGRDILSHEFAHCIMDIGLPPTLQAPV